MSELQSRQRKRNALKFHVMGIRAKSFNMSYCGEDGVLRNNEKQQLRKISRICDNIIEKWKPKVVK